MALIAAFLIKSGTLKSGSPKLKPIISIPLFLSSLALAAIARVAEAGRLFILLVRNSFIKNEFNFLPKIFKLDYFSKIYFK